MRGLVFYLSGEIARPHGQVSLFEISLPDLE
jgi:hypothetical protein